MKTLAPLGLAAAVGLAGAALAPIALAQAPAAPAAAARPRPTEPPSNTQAGVAIDRFIGDASKSPSTVRYDTMLSQVILSHGDPSQPGPPGAVLPYRKEIALNTLEAGEVTGMGKVPEQMVFYVESGEGRLDNGASWWPLKANVMVLAPPEMGTRFTATGDKPLKIISVSIPVDPGVTPKSEMTVRDVTKMAMTERNVHWNNQSKYVLLGQQDGLHPSDRVYLVYLSPMTIAGAHAHTPGQEEIWIKVTDGKAVMQLGSEIRDWPINAGFIAPPNGETVHAAMNLSDSRQAWLYVARLNPNQQPGPPPAPNPNRPPPPPAIAAGLAASNIAPTPLAPPPARPARR